MSKHRVNGKQQYRVKYLDHRTYICDWVNKALLYHYDRKMKAKNAQTGLPNSRRNKRCRC